MSEVTLMAIQILIGSSYLVWLGFIWGSWSEGRRFGGSRKIGETVIEQAKRIKQSRIFTGDGPTITNATYWALGSLGCFRIAVTETSDAEQMNIGGSKNG